MADALLVLLRRRALGLLDQARRALLASGILDNLTRAGPEWEGTPLAGNLLAAVPAPGPLEPLAAQVVNALRALRIDQPGARAGLFGWDVDGDGLGPARGIAWALRLTANGSTLVAALVADDTPQLRLIASGAVTDGTTALALGPWSLRLGGRHDGTLDLRWATDGPPTVVQATPGGTLRAELQRTTAPGQGPGIDLGTVSLGAEVTVTAAGHLTATARLRVADGALRLVPGGLASLVPGLGSIPIDVDLAAETGRGLTIGAPTLRARLPAVAALPGMALGPLHLDLAAQGLSISVNARTSLAFTLPATPLRLDLEGLGLRLPFSLGDAGRLGFDPSRITEGVPTGAGVALELPIVQVRGRLSGRGSDRYVGVLGADLPQLPASALGALSVPARSFVAILAATFPPPGIQIGFGFAVTGVGGVVGVDRRVDRDALLRAVADGSVARLLFPRGPVAAAESALAALDAIFPPSRGSVLAGPMVEFSWGRQLVTGAAALILEIAAQPRMSLIGRLVAALPAPKLPLIFIQATFAGQADPGVPSLSFLASLSGQIIGVPISGDLFLLARGGPEATFVLSGGGFHPRFAVPRGVPALRRLTLELSASPLVRLRCEAYLAITSNTVQFGGRLELVAEVAGCGLRGHLQLDVLVQFQPHLYFVADLSAAIAVRVAGISLVGVHLQLSLEGPTQWRARGRGTVELFLFSVSFSFDERWGTPHPLPGAPLDVAAALTAAFDRPEAWVLHRPPNLPAGVRLTDEAERLLGQGRIIDPFGSVTARQRVVPLEQRIERFERLPLPAPERWDITGVGIGAELPRPPQVIVSEQFAPGQFLALRDDEQLGQPAFRSFTAGGHIVSRGLVQDPRANKTADLEFEEKLIAGEQPEPFVLASNPVIIAALLRAAETIVAAGHLSHPGWWQPLIRQVTVAEETPTVAASTWSLAPLASDSLPVTLHEPATALTDTLAEDPGVTFVEAWELES